MVGTLAALACIAAFASSAAGQAVERPNPSECVGPNESVNLARLAASLGDRVVECSSDEQCEFRVDSATDFSIEYYRDYKVVWNNYTDTPYATVLYPCGTDQPDESDLEDVEDEASGVAYFPIPLYAVATDDSTTAWALVHLDTSVCDFLSLTDRVRYAPQFATSPCMLRVGSPRNESGCDRTFTPPNAQMGTPTPQNQYDAWITFAVEDEYDPDLKQIPFTAPADPSPLARTEHIVYMGAFFNMEAEAAATVRSIRQSYNNLKTEAGDDAPTMLWVQYIDDVSLYNLEGPDGEAVENGGGYQVSFAPYKVALTADAGANIVRANRVDSVETANAVLPSDTANSDVDITFATALYDSRAAMLEGVHGILENVDILIDESFIPFGESASLELFLESWGIDEGDADDFPFLADKQLWRHDKAVTADGSGDDWFGQAVLRPDLVLQDLRAIVAPDDNEDHEFVFFRNIATNGQESRQSEISAEECEDLSCNAWSNQEALPIVSMTEEAANVSDDDAGSGNNNSSGGDGGGSQSAAPRGAAAASALLLSFAAFAVALV